MGQHHGLLEVYSANNHPPERKVYLTAFFPVILMEDISSYVRYVMRSFEMEPTYREDDVYPSVLNGVLSLAIQAVAEDRLSRNDDFTDMYDAVFVQPRDELVNEVIEYILVHVHFTSYNDDEYEDRFEDFYARISDAINSIRDLLWLTAQPFLSAIFEHPVYTVDEQYNDPRLLTVEVTSYTQNFITLALYY